MKINNKGSTYVTIVVTIITLLITIGGLIYVIKEYKVQQEGIPTQTTEFYVNDFANVFTSNQKAELVAKAKNYAENQTDGIQIVITTINSLHRSTN